MAIENLDKRIGHFELNGRRAMPEQNVLGHDYSYPGNWCHLDHNRFVVTPVNFQDWALIAEIKNQLEAEDKPKRKRKVSDGD